MSSPRTYQQQLKEVLKDEQSQADYLAACLEGEPGDQAALTVALLDISSARGLKYSEFYMSEMAAVLRLSNMFIKRLGFKLVIQKIDP